MVELKSAEVQNQALFGHALTSPPKTVGIGEAGVGTKKHVSSQRAFRAGWACNFVPDDTSQKELEVP